MVEALLFDRFETLITESETRPTGVFSLGPRLGFEPVAFREGWKRRVSAITLARLWFVEAVAEIGVALGSPVETVPRRGCVSAAGAPPARHRLR